MKRLGFLLLVSTLVFAGSASAGDLVFPTSKSEIEHALSFKEQTVIHAGQEYVSNNKGEVFMVIEGKRYRMKGIGGLAQSSLVPKAGALITFGHNSSTIKEESYGILSQYGSVLQENLSGAKLVIEGHTDTQGSDNYNSMLSEERAKSVKTYLVEKFNISPDRLLIKGAGEGRPIADNDTEKGRSLNRRVEFIRIFE